MPALSTAHRWSVFGATLLCASLWLSCRPHPASASALFAPSTGYYCGPNSRIVVTGDFDLDARIDIAVGREDARVGILRGKGDGTFDPVTTYMAAGSIWALAVADFDNDGYPDIVSANDTADNFSLFLNAGDGRFREARHFSTGPGTTPQSITAADYDRDGNMDAAVGMRMLTGGHVLVFPGDGEGNFLAPVRYDTTGGVQGITSAFLNGDGSMDLATANYVSGSVSVYLNRGDGTFGPEQNYDSIPGNRSGTFFVIASDLDLDGDNDLAAVNAGNNDVSIFLGNGDGTFGQAAQFPSGDINDRSVAAADLNRDGKPDLVLSNLIAQNVISVLIGNADGTFAAPQNYVAGNEPHSVTVADFNADGKTDVVAANYGGPGFVSVFLNIVTRLPPGVTPILSPTGCAFLVLLLGAAGYHVICGRSRDRQNR